jgi:hypothetical protein
VADGVGEGLVQGRFILGVRGLEVGDEGCEVVVFDGREENGWQRVSWHDRRE